MKFLFLDIDGVLNNSSTKEKLWNGCDGIDQRLLKLFNDWYKPRSMSLVDRVEIILSSTWRHHLGCIEELNEQGIYWTFVTPRVETLEKNYGRINRGAEIQYVLDMYGDKVSHYAILDDMSPREFLKNQYPSLVQTSFVHGLRPKDLKRLDKILDI